MAKTEVKQWRDTLEQQAVKYYKRQRQTMKSHKDDYPVVLRRNSGWQEGHLNSKVVVRADSVW